MALTGGASHPKPTVGLLAHLDGPLCHYCRILPNPRNPATREHVLARSKGGPDILSNVVLSCRRCNLAKGCKVAHWQDLPLHRLRQQDAEIMRAAMLRYSVWWACLGAPDWLIAFIRGEAPMPSPTS